MPGQAHDLCETGTLIQALPAGHFPAVRAFDAGWPRNDLLNHGIIPVGPPKSNRRFLAEFSKETCNCRNLIESGFGKLKENREITMRSYKADLSFKVFICIAALSFTQGEGRQTLDNGLSDIIRRGLSGRNCRIKSPAAGRAGHGGRRWCRGGRQGRSADRRRQRRRYC